MEDNNSLEDPKAVARKLFFDYDCRTFHIAREGFWEVYQQCQISPAQEAEWHREFIAFWVGRLSVDDLEPLAHLERADAVEALPALIRIADRGDSYARMKYAEALGALTCHCKGNCFSVCGRARARSIRLKKSVLQRPVELTEQHRNEILKLLEGSDLHCTPEEYVLSRARRKVG